MVIWFLTKLYFFQKEFVLVKLFFFPQCLDFHIHSCRISIICQVPETFQTIDFPPIILFMELVRLVITGGVT